MTSSVRVVRRCNAGFTIIELMVVMTIIITLATLGLVQYSNSVVRSREAVLREDLFRMRDAIDQYYADKNTYPETLDALVTDGYLRQLPVDPFTRSSTTWLAVPAETNRNDPSAPPGVFDVKSSSEDTALDGSLYAEW